MAIMNISRGQRIKLTDIVSSGNDFQLGIACNSPGLVIDFSCFGLDASEKLSDDRYMTFFNQPSTPCGAVSLSIPTGDSAGFAITLQKLPTTIHHLIITAAIDGSGTMSQLKNGYARFLSKGTEVARFNFAGADFSGERALMLLDIYRKDNIWRISAVGQGFNGGLDALVRHFGGAVDETTSSLPSPQFSDTLLSQSKSKVVLTKPDQTHRITIEKKSGSPKKIVVRATWQDNGDDSSENDDLDLRVGILLPDGSMRFVNAPDFSGDFYRIPYVEHLGDVKTASACEPATEIVEVNPEIARHFKGRIALVFSVYSAVSNGAVSISSLCPRMILEYGQQIVEAALNFYDAKNTGYTYVLGTAVIDDNQIVLQPSGVFSEPGSEATPWLEWRGNSIRLTVDGPAYFKGSYEPQIGKRGQQYVF